MRLLQTKDHHARHYGAEPGQYDRWQRTVSVRSRRRELASNAVINFNGTPEATTVVSSTKLEAMIPAAAIMTPAMVPVTVTNPGGSGGIYGGGMSAVSSAPMNFTIN